MEDRTAELELRGLWSGCEVHTHARTWLSQFLLVFALKFMKY